MPIGVYNRKKSVTIPPEENEQKPTIKIKHHVMPLQEALDLIQKFQGEYGPIREEIKEQLKVLPEGQAYVFSVGDTDKKKAHAIQYNIQKMLFADGGKYAIRYSKTKKVFVVFPKSYTNKTNGKVKS
jgi:hypothetical protein